MPTLLGICFIVVAIILGVRRRYLWVLSLAAAVPIGVMTNAGNNGVPVFYFFAIGALIAIVLCRSANFRRQKLPGWNLLLAFVVWSVFVTLLSPGLFSGVAVLSPSGGIDSQLVSPSALAYSMSNLAQTGYLILGAVVVFYLGNAKNLSPMFLSGALAGLTLLSTARLASIRLGTPFPERFFDNSTGVAYVEGAADGTQRFRGIFAEPSELAIASLVAAVFFLASSTQISGVKRLAAIILAGLAIVNMAESTATSAVASTVIFLIVLSTYHCVRFFFLQGKVRIQALIVIPLLLPFIAAMSPHAIAGIIDTLATKTGTSSFGVRTGSDMFSLHVFTDTWGLGAGLGSNRPASFLAMLLSNVGIIGVVLFVLASAALLCKAWSVPSFKPTCWAFLALFSGKLVASPNLSDPLIWVILGVMASAVWGQIPQIPKPTPMALHATRSL